jgi:uncharacterized protein YeaO (DUF488 family)
MKCHPHTVKDEAGKVIGAGFVCTSGARRSGPPCRSCGEPKTSLLCDYDVGRGKTCDAPICGACRTNIGEDRDLCPPHAAELKPGVLLVQTARLGYRGAGWLDISLQGNMRRVEAGEPGGQDGIGVSFAPSPALLYPFLSKRKHKGLTQADWAEYSRLYVLEMRRSYRRDHEAWRKLLERPHVVLLCFCTTPHQCHRTVLARDILPKLGAVYAGEVRG